MTSTKIHLGTKIFSLCMGMYQIYMYVPKYSGYLLRLQKWHLGTQILCLFMKSIQLTPGYQNLLLVYDVYPADTLSPDPTLCWWHVSNWHTVPKTAVRLWRVSTLHPATQTYLSFMTFIRLTPRYPTLLFRECILLRLWSLDVANSYV